MILRKKQFLLLGVIISLMVTLAYASESVNLELPSISLNIEEPVYSSKPIIVSFESTPYTLQYQLVLAGKTGNNSLWLDVSNNQVVVDVEGLYGLYYRVVDLRTGKSVMSKKYTVCYDISPPLDTGVELLNNKASQSFDIILHPNDDIGSPVDKIMYKINDGEWHEYTKKLRSFSVKDIVLYTYQIDKAGNRSDVAESELYLSYDKILSVPSVKAIGETVSNKQVTFKLMNANSAFLYEYQFVPSGGQVSSNWINYDSLNGMTVYDSGSWDLYVKTSYGEQSADGKVATCIVDKEAPKITDVSRLSVVDKSVAILNISATDKLSKLNLKYSFNNGKTWSSDSTKTVKEDTLFRLGDIRVRDECGNVSTAPCGYKVTIKNGVASFSQVQAYYLVKGLTVKVDAVKNGYVSGMGDGNFGPDQNVTRAQLARMINNIVDFKNPLELSERIRERYDILEQSPDYVDINDSFWAYKDIRNIQAYKILKIDSDSYYPMQAVTRAELAHVLCRIMDLLGVYLDGSSLEESGLVDVSGEYTDDILKVYAVGLMLDDGQGRFGTNDELTRAEIVKAFNGVISIQESAAKTGLEFKDVPKSHWAYQDILKASRAEDKFKLSE